MRQTLPLVSLTQTPPIMLPCRLQLLAPKVVPQLVLNPGSRFQKCGCLCVGGRYFWPNLAPHVYSLKQNLTLLVSLWHTAQPPCPSPGTLRDSRQRAIFHRERRECSADGGWARDLGGVQGASHGYSMNVQG